MYAVKGGKLSFKGEPKKTAGGVKKRKRKDGPSADGSGSKAGASVKSADPTWIPCFSPAYLSGPMLLLTGTTSPPAFVTSPEKSTSLCLTSPPAAAPGTPEPPLVSVVPAEIAQVFVCQLLPSSTPTSHRVSLKSAWGRYLGSDAVGLVKCEMEAISGNEEWEWVWLPSAETRSKHSPQKVGLKNWKGSWLRVVDGVLRADGDDLGDEETFFAQCQSSNAIPTSSAIKKSSASNIPSAEDEVNANSVQVDGRAFEIQQLKKYQSWINGRVLTEEDKATIDKAKAEGKIHEALLLTRSKLKHDKFC